MPRAAAQSPEKLSPARPPARYRYNKIRVLGRGSFGTAWLAEDAITGEQVAMKEIVVAGVRPRDAELALGEVELLRKLRHPYIIRYKEAFCAGGQLHICMEYASGGDLHSRVKRQQTTGHLFPQAKVLDWFTQLTMALDYLHARRILHRDLKTHNIFLSARDHVKLGDFGISKVLSANDNQTATLVGTPYYLSPEICMGKPYGAPSDCWAAGCVLYELLTLQHAFRANSINALAVKIIAGRYPPPPASYDPAVHDLVAALLQHEPQKRLAAAGILQHPLLERHVLKYARGLREGLVALPQLPFPKVMPPLPPPPSPPPPSMVDMPVPCQDAGLPTSVPAVAPPAEPSPASSPALQTSIPAPSFPPPPSPPPVPTSPSRWNVEHANFQLPGAATLPLAGVDSSDGVYTRMEALRVHLEQQLGEERLQQAHAALEAVINSTSPVSCGLESVRQLLGSNGDSNVLTLLVQLVHCESYFFVVIGA